MRHGPLMQGMICYFEIVLAYSVCLESATGWWLLRGRDSPTDARRCLNSDAGTLHTVGLMTARRSFFVCIANSNLDGKTPAEVQFLT